MSWVIASVGLGVGGAGIGYLDGKNRQEQERAALMANAEQIRYSPWTHMASQVKGQTAGSPLLAGLKGGIQGGMAGAMMAAGNPAAAAAAPAASGALQTNAAASTLGGNQMSNQLGQQANTFSNSMGSQFQVPTQPQFVTLRKSTNLYGG